MSTTHESTSTGAPAPVRRNRVRFTFEGRTLEGTEGQSIAAALFAAGERTLSYSVKFHRPRGILCGRGRCSACAVNVDGEPGVKACATPLAEGMVVRRQEARPWFAPLLTVAARVIPFPSGFYYRFFTRPKWVRESFLGSLRRMAGVGTVNTSSSRSRGVSPPRPAVAAITAGSDVLVVGAGVSGMAAAVAAAGQGASVRLVDEYPHLGGHAVGPLGDPSATRARDDLIASARGGANITVVTGATVQALYPDRSLMIQAGGGGALHRVRVANVVLATGALDTIPLFANNDTPGVMGTRALRLFIERDGLVPGTRAVVLGTGRDGDDAVALLESRQVRVVARLSDERIVSVEGGAWVNTARIDRGGRVERVECDLVVVAVRGQPDFTLAQQAGFTFAFDGSRGDYGVMLPTLQQIELDGQRVFLVGETAGVTGWLEKVEHAAQQGALAGRTT
jgi:sarcosine oxidase subunit alpha